LHRGRRSYHRRGPAALRPAALGLAALVLAVVAVNEVWIHHDRAGLPFDIDESGYLQRALRDAGALAHGGPGGLWRAYRLPDPQAPVLPVTAGIFHWATGAGPLGLLWVQQFFLVVLLVSTYAGARRLVNQWWSLVAAGTVACIPGVLDEARGFHFGLAAAALFTAALAVQLHAGSFERLTPSLAWGVLLGLTSLTRTMMLALVPLLVVAAALPVASRWRSRRGLHFAAGVAAGAAVAASWYSATWTAVWHYLTSYGYGARSAGYGRGHSPLSPGWWTARFDLLLHSELLLPLTAIIPVSVLAALAGAAGRVLSLRAGAIRSRLPPGVDSPYTTLLVVTFGSYLVLSSTRNAGLDFELPMLPATVMLAVAAASRLSRVPRRAAAAGFVALGAVSFLGTTGMLDPVAGPTARLSWGRVQLPLWDGRGPLMAYASPALGACPVEECHGAVTGEAARRYLAGWIAPSETAATDLQSFAAHRGFRPVVFFAAQDELFNTNTVDLAYQAEYGTSLPTGLLQDPETGHESLVGQLTDPARGQPNLVVTGPPAAGAADYSPLADQPAGIAALMTLDFHPVMQLALPDGRRMTIWWEPRGPRVPESPQL
jgi:hypothetical protein